MLIIGTDDMANRSEFGQCFDERRIESHGRVDDEFTGLEFYDSHATADIDFIPVDGSVGGVDTRDGCGSENASVAVTPTYGGVGSFGCVYLFYFFD